MEGRRKGGRGRGERGRVEEGEEEEVKGGKGEGDDGRWVKEGELEGEGGERGGGGRGGEGGREGCRDMFPLCCTTLAWKCKLASAALAALKASSMVNCTESTSSVVAHEVSPRAVLLVVTAWPCAPSATLYAWSASRRHGLLVYTETVW